MPKKKPNVAAQVLGKLRWKGKSKAERAAVADALTKARESIPAEVRAETARKAAAARWQGHKKAERRKRASS